ncbi:MAG TPA: c-type cytochrome [Hanamia sp.]|nr:c-type cytochrome [Hanamia sp.]
MKRIMLLGILSMTLLACNSGGSGNSSKMATDTTTVSGADTNANAGSAAPYDSTIGVGKFTHVDLAPNVNEALASGGEVIYGAKCAACHKLTDEKLVGPGWKGVTIRHKPAWIMNFITNTEEMLNKDPRAKELLQICLVRMPNQNLSDDQARQILEFMRKNDGVK